MCRGLLRIQGWHCFKRCFTSLERQFLRLVKNERDKLNEERTGSERCFLWPFRLKRQNYIIEKNPLFQRVFDYF